MIRLTETSCGRHDTFNTNFDIIFMYIFADINIITKCNSKISFVVDFSIKKDKPGKF